MSIDVYFKHFSVDALVHSIKSLFTLLGLSLIGPFLELALLFLSPWRELRSSNKTMPHSERKAILLRNVFHDLNNEF